MNIFRFVIYDKIPTFNGCSILNIQYELVIQIILIVNGYLQWFITDLLFYFNQHECIVD